MDRNADYVFRVAVLNTHPIQYFAPLYGWLAQNSQLDLTVYFCSPQGVEAYLDKGFGQEVKWDVPLLDGYRHCFLPNLRRSHRVGGFFSLINPALVGELRRQRYDALWLHGHAHATNLLALLAARLLGTRVFMRCETHLLLRRSAWKRALRRPALSLLYRLCDACVYIGTRNQEFYSSLGVPEDRLFLVPYTVNNVYFEEAAARARPMRDELRAELGISRDSVAILFASKMTARKRPMDLLLAYERLVAQGLPASLLYVCDGEQRSALEEYAARRNLHGVRFVGFRNQSELPAIYAASDVFVLPSIDEPWGLVINEVMCAGLPVVTTEEVGAAPDLVRHGENGFVYQATSVQALADHLATLVQDKGLRQKMGAASRRLIAGWDYDRCVRGVLEALYATIGGAS